MPRLFVVGDSTLSKFNDTSYYYPRYGYATMLDSYFDIEVINLALSGRSSRSYLLEDNYKFLCNFIEKGDYLLIGFGHNDEKDDDYIRFSSADLDIDNPLSIKYVLYNKYIKMAQDKGATPILATPIVRLDKNLDFSGNSGHITNNGDYRQAILDLASSLGIVGIDLTTPTKELFLSLGYEKARYHHAMTAAIKKNDCVSADVKSVDKAHLNIYGARYAAYLFALGISNTNSGLNKYLKELKKPEIDTDLIVNPEFKYIDYVSPDLINYQPIDRFKCTSSNWYGTAFGDFGIVPSQPEAGFIATEKDNTLIVGQAGDALYGRMHASTDAIAYAFTQIDLTQNFKIRAVLKVLKCNKTKQTGFGIMLRDDCYINQDVEKHVVATNYVSAGFITADASTYIIFSRESTTEQNKEYVVDELYSEGDEAVCYIKRLGQLITVKVSYMGKVYEKNYFDFDLAARDSKYMYVGVYATRGTVVAASEIKLTMLGLAKEA